jgi:diguanylate cyclase (GGDEF)-like protein
MECTFLDSYAATLHDDAVRVWYCRKRDPFVLGASKEVAMATCSSCRLSDFGRPPAELAMEVERRNAELVALNAIVSAVNASLDLDTVLAMGLEKVMEILQVDAGWVSLARGGDRFEMDSHRGVSETLAADVREARVGEGIVGMVVEAGETMVIDDLAAGPVPLPAARAEGLVTLLGVPLKAQGRILAVLILATREARAYSAEDIYFAVAAGGQLAAAIERALLFREQVERAERERRLLEAAETVNRSLDSDLLAPTILAKAAGLMGATKAALLARSGDIIVVRSVHGLSERYRKLFVLPLNDSLSGRALVLGETVAVSDVDVEVAVDAVLVTEGGFRSFITAPLQSSAGIDGAITVYFDEVREFSDDDRTLLRTFAVQAAIALENRRLMHEKDQMAVRDGLTGVYNRSYLELCLERTTHELRRNGGQASVLFLDVDNMKTVNDGLGHQMGDRQLQDLAAVLASCCRESDIVARYGGDEFVILMPGTGTDGAKAVTDKIAVAMARRNDADPTLPPLLASVGMHTAGGGDVETLLRDADRRMYAMKRARQRESA